MANEPTTIQHAARSAAKEIQKKEKQADPTVTKEWVEVRRDQKGKPGKIILFRQMSHGPKYSDYIGREGTVAGDAYLEKMKGLGKVLKG